ncbi:Gfo/Idh/MocA family protein [Isobaculum melis]|uniref:Predicted dehydrogenase n=1 Tax=Isobaculum melis TaxID=142588 RepID=A0A1H9TYT8_9LACT|nr:Gfo/Idh/MocA family oxidoreductase [Isobaculum melis]SES02087.1 Predicted dehydrogenase [Isobaculum melis]
MIKLGVIGTNWITDAFISAALETKKWTLTAVYSRTIEKAQDFGAKYQVSIFLDDIEKFAEHPEIEAVYIASPNSLHFEQAITLMEAGKHVIIEKPMFSNPAEWAQAVKVAKENQVLMLEAARHIHEPNFQIVKEQIKQLGTIEGATFTYMKYSSRYDQVLAGAEPNIFSLHYSGGALSDLGVYSVYAALGWFGMPEKVHYFAHKIQTGVDGMGTIILRYPQFDVTLLTGKIVQSYLPSEIYGQQGTIVMDAVNAITQITTIDTKTGKEVSHAKPAKENPMYHEAMAFAEVINNPTLPDHQAKYEEWLQLSKNVNQVLKALREDAAIVFDAD